MDYEQIPTKYLKQKWILIEKFVDTGRQSNNKPYNISLVDYLKGAEKELKENYGVYPSDSLKEILRGARHYGVEAKAAVKLIEETFELRQLQN